MDIINYAGIQGWAVTDQAADQLIITPAGQPVTGTQVFFATEKGWSGSVFIPDEHYTKEKVHKAVNIRARLTDEVGALVRDSFGGN